ncbi:MAG: hypothetical protein ACPL4H_10540 [Anaerolineales bacterium]
MAWILSVPILAGLLMFQIGVLNNLPLLHGYSDLVMLTIIAWALQKNVTTAWQWGILGGIMMTIVSALPLGVYLICYLILVGMTLLIKKIVWRIPLISMLLVTVVGTFLVLGSSYTFLRITNIQLPLSYSFREIMLPSALLNVILAIPIYAFMSEVAKWLYPEVIEV